MYSFLDIRRNLDAIAFAFFIRSFPNLFKEGVRLWALIVDFSPSPLSAKSGTFEILSRVTKGERGNIT